MKNTLTFTQAIEHLESGHKLKRMDWDKKSGKGYLKIIQTKEPKHEVVNQEFVALFYINGGVKMPHPYLFDMFDIRGQWKIFHDAKIK